MYRTTGRQHEEIILWGFPESAYSAKLRSYFTKRGIPYVERFPVETRFKEEIQPLIGYLVVPIIELRDGLLLQDSTTTLLHFEASERSAEYPSLAPESPVQNAVAWLLNFFGTDGFMMVGMHYRWSYIEENKPIVGKAFMYWTSEKLTLPQRKKEAAEMMALLTTRTAHFGISADTAPVIEQSWFECLEILEKHFSAHPYLLGGKPSVADCGLMSMFHAHLARDPHPSLVMKTKAPNVFRWTERMNQRGFFDGEFPYTAPKYFPGDELPETLIPLLRHLVADCGEEIRETIAAFNRWTDANDDLAQRDALGASLLGSPDPAHTPFPSFALIEYPFRGKNVRRLGFMNTVYQLQQVQEIADRLDAQGARRFRQVLDQVDGGWMLDLRAARRVKYAGYHYVLA